MEIMQMFHINRRIGKKSVAHYYNGINTALKTNYWYMQQHGLILSKIDYAYT